MLTPGPDHPITITPAGKRWRARFQGHVIADTGDALILKEASYPPVVYFPRADVDMAYMSRTDRSTHCPYKGDASYYTVLMDGHFGENAVWTYEEPFPAMETIRERLAFYPDKVEVYAVEEAQVNPRAAGVDVDAVVQHTDAGDGHSQREHWTPKDDVPRPEGV
ncbi:DUF427 domain-containing protein [Phenylobacterium sp.]|uniref:DUF427 domain-containing protein n=1 Tax=Phenylobacterium sp. TaxID=1871053 RepID=UPI002735614C|nr:DUF427 domain-containing protein [Phenylobacterium sp.]MDP3658839.1 DUF427 domain-containing protein [Phenylobacterium sp.]